MRKISILVILCFVCLSAFGDGGRLRFSKAAGPFLVTLFTSPEPLTPGLVDLSVMVQDSQSGKILQNAAVNFRLSGPKGRIVRAMADHRTATNKLLQAADVELKEAGVWTLQVDLEEGSHRADLTTTVDVAPGTRRALLVWIFALLPLLVVLMFVLNQQHKVVRRKRPRQA